MKILFVDEDYDDFEIFYDVATSISSSIECVRVTNCGDANLELTKAQTLDFLFVDGFIISHRGYDCFQAMVTTALAKGAQVVMYTNSDMKGTGLVKEEGRNIGFMVKPSTLRDLETALRRLIESQP